MNARAEIRITGLVQGVFFRQATKEMAEELGVFGWVRNESDGSVKIAAEGEKTALEKLVAWVKKGTELAKVEKVEVEWGKATGEFKEFQIGF